MTACRTTRRRRGVRLALLAVVVAALLGPLPAPPAATAPVLAVPELRWSDCGDGLECSTARVPLDYDTPRGPGSRWR